MDNINVKSIVLFLLCISIVLHVAGYTAIAYEDQSGATKTVISEFVELRDETNAQKINVSSNFKERLDAMTNPAQGAIETSLMAAINVIKMLGEFLKMLVNIALAPLVLFTGIAGIPFNVALMLGLPILVAYFLAIAYFIRGMN